MDKDQTGQTALDKTESDRFAAGSLIFSGAIGYGMSTTLAQFLRTQPSVSGASQVPGSGKY